MKCRFIEHQTHVEEVSPARGRNRSPCKGTAAAKAKHVWIEGGEGGEDKREETEIKSSEKTQRKMTERIHKDQIEKETKMKRRDKTV